VALTDPAVGCDLRLLAHPDQSTKGVSGVYGRGLRITPAQLTELIERLQSDECKAAVSLQFYGGRHSMPPPFLMYVRPLF